MQALYKVKKGKELRKQLTLYELNIYFLTNVLNEILWNSFLNVDKCIMVAQMVKKIPIMQETWVWFLGQEDPLEKGMATHSSILAWRIPWIEEPGGLYSPWDRRVGCNWATFTHTHTHTHIHSCYQHSNQDIKHFHPPRKFSAPDF